MWMLAVGLFAAGLSSAITAPLAAAITARGLFAADDNDRWLDASWRYRLVWLAVLVCGLGFGLAEARPIPAIILAQALNGVLLPLVAAVLFIIANDRRLLGAAHVNRSGQNVLMLCVFAITVVLGTNSILRAAARAAGAGETDPRITLAIAAAVAVAGSVMMWRRAISVEKSGEV